MLLLSLTLEDFRNFAQVVMTPSPRATIAVGQNGQGKTNLLEAIYFLATLKPLRANKLSELVRFGQPKATVRGRFTLKGAEREISVEVTQGIRQAFVDGKRAQSLEDYFGGVSVVAFTPEDLAVVKGAPDGRRAFLDRAVFNRFPAFLAESRAYARALKSRNRLLKEGASAGYLEAFDETLAKTGARVLVRRRALLQELAPRAEAAFTAIGRTEAQARFTYRPSCDEPRWHEGDEAALCAALGEGLSAKLGRDRERGFTSVGPHADDLVIGLAGRAAKSYASQGQQRALVLGWKVAEIENLTAALGVKPLLLLDDVSSELDPERNAYLMEYVSASGAQLFLSTTDPKLVSRAALGGAVWYQVRAGTLEPVDEP